MMKVIFGIIISYLLGTIPTAYIFAKIIKGIDIREHGSGNVGATNALRLLGKLPGIIVLIIDFCKGFLAVTLISRIFISSSAFDLDLLNIFFGLAVVCGHVFNVFLSGKGGKGVATSAGVILGVSPVSLLIAVILFIIIISATRYVSLGSIISSVSVPFIMLFTKTHSAYLLLGSFLAIIIVIKHKTNIKRLLTGTEKKLFEK